LTEEDLKQIKHDHQIISLPCVKRKPKSRKSSDENGNILNWRRETLSATTNEHWKIHDQSIGKIQTPKRLSNKSDPNQNMIQKKNL
jgi:hypothetical protein